MAMNLTDLRSTRSKFPFEHTRVRVPRPLLLCVVALLGAARQVEAYTDPGTGALIWQMLVAGFVGALFYVRRFTSWFRTRKKDNES